ncbi:MAG TPA: ATP-binding cassette domain-containing protein, partial [Terriglobales bacterium]|nr:ATP-binding cassette domain-containing protein [Terriglobales bacterium]
MGRKPHAFFFVGLFSAKIKVSYTAHKKTRSYERQRSAFMHAIEIAGLEKTYHVGFLRKKEKVALKPLSLAVDAGEVFGFLGPNGAGKTTTL